MEKVDYKKKYKDLYTLVSEPTLIAVPPINFVAVTGKGNPNTEGGDFKKALEILYSISYTVKMGHKDAKGYFEYVVPPLEGLWWFEGQDFKPTHIDKDKFGFTAMIRLPEFIDKELFDSVKTEVKTKKKIDVDNAEFFSFSEGLCVQCLHTGHFDEEVKTVEKIEEYIIQNNLANDIGQTRHHHEIYLSDFRKCEPSKWKTVLRIPVRNK